MWNVVSWKIWTRDRKSISYVDNRYATSALVIAAV